MIRIIENILSETETDEIEKTLLGWNFGWFHYANTNYSDLGTRGDDVPQFSHGFMRDGESNSPYVKIPLKIMNAVGVPEDKILRAKANLLVWERERKIHPPHTDDPNPHYAMIYYVNNADGETCFYKEGNSYHSISPQKGNAVLFDGDILHSSSSPVESRFRVVINFNIARDVAFIK